MWRAIHRADDAETADREEKMWRQVMVEGGLRDDIAVTKVSRGEFEADGTIWLPKLLKLVGFCPSSSEARRLISGGGVSVDRQKVLDPKAVVTPTDGMIVQVGKRRVTRLEVE